MMKVFIDPGHGGRDPGAVGNDLREKDIVLAIGLKVGDILKRHDIEVVYSRSTDVFIELVDRAKKANNSNANIFVSIHVNSFTDSNARGLETFSHVGSTKGAVLAKNLQDQLVLDKIFTVNRGIKTANFAVLRLTKMPAALVELGFISNYHDAEIMRNKQSEMAKSVARAIFKNLGIKYVEKKEVAKDIDNPSTWAKEDWAWGVENKITDGSNPGRTATREEVVAMIRRSKEVK